MPPLLLLLLQHLLPQQSLAARVQFREGAATRTLVGADIRLPSPLPPVAAFRGLQFAAVGRLDGRTEHRFARPVAAFKYSFHRPGAVLQRRSYRPVCPQRLPQLPLLRRKASAARVQHVQRVLPFLLKQDEECLFLNVYVPAPAARVNASRRQPVAVFVHGDSYNWGSGNAYDLSVFCSLNDVLGVTINYRLGPLGFLAASSAGAAGNYALMDLREAVQWVHANIWQFGGDPNGLTLIGHGMGAALVSLLMSSGFAQVPSGQSFLGVRHVALLSGSGLSPMATSDGVTRSASANLLRSLNLSDSGSEQLMQQLRRQPVERLLRLGDSPDAWRPVAGGGDGLFPADVAAASSSPSSALSGARLLIGFGASAGQSELPASLGDGLAAVQFSAFASRLVRRLFRYRQRTLLKLLLNFYSDPRQLLAGGRPAAKSRLRQSVAMATDAMVASPCLRAARLHAGRAPTFVYVFAFATSQPRRPRWAAGLLEDDLAFGMGAPIAARLRWPLPPFSSDFLLEDAALAEAFVAFLGNFVISGDPNRPRNQTSRFGGHISNKFVSLQWPQFEDSSQRYMHFGKVTESSVRQQWQAQRMQLWQSLIPAIHVADGLPASHHLLLPQEAEATKTTATATAPASTTTKTRSGVGEMSNDGGRWWSSGGEGSDGKQRAASAVEEPREQRSGRVRTTPISASEGGGAAAAAAAADASQALAWTVAAGCGLLLLNVLVFAGIYRQAGRLRSSSSSSSASGDVHGGGGGGGGGGGEYSRGRRRQLQAQAADAGVEGQTSIV